MDESGRIPERRDNKRALVERFRRRAHPEETRPVPERFTTIELGSNQEDTPLPIVEFKDVIVDTVSQNQVSIIVAETGAGKSTQVPQYLLEHGFTVGMTQPRRMAARMVSERIDEELTGALGDDAYGLVGLHTAEHNTITDRTRITVLTDGLRLVQELNEREDVENEVLIIDEVHEWNTNIEVLVAWTKNLIKDKPNLRVLLMSASIDAHRLADYYEDTGQRPPIIEVPGRTFGIDKIEEPHSTVLEQVVSYAKAENNILVFLPGVREINDMKRDLEERFADERMADITVLPLHGKLSDEDQRAVDRFYPGPKIILSTNVAQTSLTIKDVDVVVDSGLERRVEIDEEGVQSLRLHAISKADSDQRAGRSGRTHPGVYVLTRLDHDTEYVSYISRDEYPTAEILRSDVDRNTLAVAAAGLNFSELDLFHPVDADSLVQSQHRLRLLGALDERGAITLRGARMNKFPVHPTSSRMLIEAEKYSDEVRAYVAAVVASIEVGKLPSYLYNASKEWKSLTHETRSDHLAQLDIFIHVQDDDTDRELLRGLDIRNVKRARELHRKIVHRSGLKHERLQEHTEKQREEIVECVTAGLVDFIYEASRKDVYVRALGHQATERVISSRSSVTNPGNLVVATPYQYHHPRKGEVRVIETVTAITPRILGRVASALCDWQPYGETKWRNGLPVTEERQVFRNHLPTGDWHEEPSSPSVQLRTDIIAYVIDNPGPAQRSLRTLKKELEKLRRLAGDRVPAFTQDQLVAYIQRATPDDITDPSLVDEYLRRIIYEEDVTLDAFAPAQDRADIYDTSPDSVTCNGVNWPIRYSHGQPRIHINDLASLVHLDQELYLLDGRKIQFLYQRRPYSLDSLQQLTP